MLRRYQSGVEGTLSLVTKLIVMENIQGYILFIRFNQPIKINPCTHWLRFFVEIGELCLEWWFSIHLQSKSWNLPPIAVISTLTKTPPTAAPATLIGGLVKWAELAKGGRFLGDVQVSWLYFSPTNWEAWVEFLATEHTIMFKIELAAAWLSTQ